MPRGLQRLLITVGALALAVLLAVVGVLYLLLQPDRFTAMLQGQAQKAGLVLNLASPASPTLFPRPALDLRGITLNAAGADSPILLAAHGRLVLPWRTLFGGPTAIAQMEVDAPRVDLDALQGWLATLPPQPAGSAPVMPRIDAGISIEHGSVMRGDQLLLNNVTLTAGTLALDQEFPLGVSATTATGAPLQLRLTTTPHMHGNTLQLNDIQLHLSQGSGTTLALRGNARWHGAANATAQLGGKLDQADAGSYDIAVTLAPANQTEPLLLHLRLDGPANHADLLLPPLALAHWWSTLNAPAGQQAGPQPAMPPGSGTLQVAKLQVGSLSIEGLSVQAGNAAPTPAAATAKPAATPARTGGKSK
ncbi:membrane assembly protein AsmA [Rhodanobacter geophilus]|uniref:Membrane assembly protein AsmA n=1 Tax=Rhodanobacter geophilus TaxID=3162488 RepID=A0ABV3QP37_9GAMM